MMPLEGTSEKLFSALRSLYNNRDFVVGAMSYARSDEDRKKLLDYIENGEDVTVESILLLALHLSQSQT